MLAMGCFGCHGPEGRSQRDAIPSLAGLSEEYFTQVMEAYRFGGRFSTVMGRIALGYGPQETERLARYFSGIEPTPVKQRVKRDLARKGKVLHRHFCRKCHGDPEHPADEDSVLLNGQWMNYLRWTLRDYLVGINQTDAEMTKKLKALVRRHGEPGLEALVHYYGGSGL
jgi:sulfide dehydrogenase cytochrome subunit